MINRNNYLKSRAFLDYVDQVTQVRPGSVQRYRFYLKHLLVWIGEYPLKDAGHIQPSFPAYLACSRLDGRRGSLAPATAKKVIQVCKRFLTWARLAYPTELDSLPQLWIDSLRPPRIVEEPADHEFVTLDEMKAIASLSVDDGDVILQRDRAAACLLYLSGMRAGAFVSLPILALDLGAGSVQQWPSLGVRTKNSKSATTYLIDIPDLLEPAIAWDRYVRAGLPETAMWFTPTVNHWGDQRLSGRPPGSGRVSALGRRMRKLFAVAGLPYKSPHKFRHGHAVLALQHARDMADYKAVSTNLMHGDIRVTDGIYARLAGKDVQRRINGLTRSGCDPGQSFETTGPATSGELSRQQIADRLVDLAHRLTG